MNRLLAMVAALLGTSVALANFPPPPRGFPQGRVKHKITTDKEYPDYIFYSTVNGFPEVKARDITELKLDPKTPITIDCTKVGFKKAVQLIAVPKDAKKKFDSEKEFLAALADGKVEGVVRTKNYFSKLDEPKIDKGQGKVVVKEYKIEKIDPKEGIVLVEEKGAEAVPEPPAPPKESPEDSDESCSDGVANVYTPKGGVWIAGLAGAFSVVLAGLWIVRRPRNHLEPQG